MLIKRVLRRPEHCKEYSLSVKADNFQVARAGSSRGAMAGFGLAGGAGNISDNEFKQNAS